MYVTHYMSNLHYTFGSPMSRSCRATTERRAKPRLGLPTCEKAGLDIYENGILGETIFEGLAIR